MGKIRNPNPPPKETRFQGKWKTGKASERPSLPPAITPDVMAIAHCIDADPTIAPQVLAFAQSLVEKQKALHTAVNS